MDASSNIKVFVRVRPNNQSENTGCGETVVSIENNDTVILSGRYDP